MLGLMILSECQDFAHKCMREFPCLHAEAIQVGRIILAFSALQQGKFVNLANPDH